jgi:hypothetical protein
MGAADGTNDVAFGAAVGTKGCDLDQDAIAVHGRADEGRRDEDIAGKARLQIGIEGIRFGDDETVAIAMHAEASDEHVLARGGLGNGVPVAIDLAKLALADEGVQPIIEFPASFTLYAEFADKLLEAGRLLGLAGDVAEDLCV